MSTDHADARSGQEEIRVSNRATYWPVSPIDVVVCAPLVARILFGATPVGRVMQALAIGAYFASALRDWRDRRAIRKIVFQREFGADTHHLVPMPRELRETEVRILVERLNDEFVPQRLARRELAIAAELHLTGYIASISGQRVRTSAEVRGFALVGLAVPFALGACDVLTGDIAIFRDTGLFEPHIIAHELSHRKGYWKELHAQALAYLALAGSGVPVLVQSALVERLHRNLCVLSGGDECAFDRLMTRLALRSEVGKSLLALRPSAGRVGQRMEAAMRGLYERRLRLTGQNGVSDYDLGFTNFLYTFETSTTAQQVPPSAGAVHRREFSSGRDYSPLNLFPGGHESEALRPDG